MNRESPLRTCVSCRRVVEKSRLLRFVLTPEKEVVPDLANRLPGRGVYTCALKECVSKAVQRNLFSRGLKSEVAPVDPAALIADVIMKMQQRIASYIALANKAGKILSGSDMVMEHLKKNRTSACLVLLAGDISEDIGQRIGHMADLSGIPCHRLMNKDRFGELLGKGLRSAIVVQGEGFVGSLSRELERFGNFLRGEGCLHE